MAKIEPRWGSISKGALIGLERIIAQQQVLVYQARATVNALTDNLEDMEKGDGENDSEFALRQARNQNAIEATAQDLDLKEAVLSYLAEEYVQLLEKGLDVGDTDDEEPLDTSILEDSHEASRGKDKE